MEKTEARARPGHRWKSTRDTLAHDVMAATSQPLPIIKSINDAMLAAIQGSLEDGKSIEIRGFGTFKTRKRRAREARNPRTMEAVSLPDRWVIIFKAAPAMLREMNRHRSV